MKHYGDDGFSGVRPSILCLHAGHLGSSVYCRHGLILRYSGELVLGFITEEAPGFLRLAMC